MLLTNHNCQSVFQYVCAWKRGKRKKREKKSKPCSYRRDIASLCIALLLFAPTYTHITHTQEPVTACKLPPISLSAAGCAESQILIAPFPVRHVHSSTRTNKMLLVVIKTKHTQKYKTRSHLPNSGSQRACFSLCRQPARPGSISDGQLISTSSAGQTRGLGRSVTAPICSVHGPRCPSTPLNAPRPLRFRPETLVNPT